MTDIEYARNDDDRCWHEECWRLNGHTGGHAYHPAFSGDQTDMGDQ